MTEGVIGLGSNVGNGRENVSRAWELLGEKKDVFLQGLSSPYFTEPVGMDSRNWFTNCVGLIETELTPEDLLSVLHEIEETLGRYRQGNNEIPVDRTVDLDLLFFSDLVTNSATLVVPHPEIQNRLFVLAPLAELLPNQRHPVLDLTAAQMLTRLISSEAQMRDRKKVKKMAWTD